jgi:hypothetical protein
MRIKFGSIVKDPITGFQGIAVSRHEYLTGCTRIGVQSQKLHDGKPINPETFDEPQLQVLGELDLANPESAKDNLNGGPRETPGPKFIPSR